MKTIVKVRKSFEWEGITIRLANVLFDDTNIKMLTAIAPNNGAIKDFKPNETLKNAEFLTVGYLNARSSFGNLTVVKKTLTEKIGKDNMAYCADGLPNTNN